MSDYELYGGDVKLKFLASKHQYTVDNNPVPSVTAITGIMDKSGPLMWWAVGEALDYVRKTYEETMDEVQFEEMLADAKYAHAKKSRGATTIGHMAHEWIHEHFSGIEKPMPKNPKLRASIESFLDWINDNRVDEVKATEFKVYSRKYHYAGTCDFDGVINQERCIADWKTGSRVYPEHGLQTVAYKKAREEELGIKYDARWVVVLPKDGGEVITERFGPEADELYWQGFLGALNLYKTVKEIKR